MSMQLFRLQCAQINAAAERELQDQTPPKGDAVSPYHCPACGQHRELRSEMRSHLQMCEKFRDYVLASIRRKDLALPASQLVS